MTAAEIRQSFLNFFQQKQHTIVPSASLLPQSPGLLFTNAGMNQFVPFFLGTEKAPYQPPRATDTQKCIRAGGKHNDLDDVGYDTYHHTMFEMLGNWSFGDYFKKEAIEWGWELVVEKWGFPAERLYATVYMPDKDMGDPSEFDQEAYDFWAAKFESKGLDPKKHVVNGDKKDNFWMMGATGPCGPCSELHVDLTPNADTEGKLVNMDSDLCIEIWNLVFIQYNAEEDGSFRDLPSRHVDTGMGFERACSIYQGTNGFTDFSKKPTNYSTDVFSALFKKLEELTEKTYQDIYPATVDVDKSSLSADMKDAIAFRVIADHIRTLSFSIADGILPGNTGRNYVLRRILRRAVNYGRTLGFMGDTPFLPELVDTLVTEFGEVFPELNARAEAIKKTLRTEEESFNKTLTRGLQKFEKELENTQNTLSGDFAFQLYDTFGFPIDLTEILCQQNGIKLDKEKFDTLMKEQKQKGKENQKTTIVKALDVSSDAETEFVGFDTDMCDAKVLEIHEDEQNYAVITDKSPFYVEMGGQEGDTGFLDVNGVLVAVKGVNKIGNAIAHIVTSGTPLKVGDTVELSIDPERRRPIEAHHTATHILHWALHQVVSEDASQQGSLVSPERLRFDFSSEALSQEQLAALEAKVNEVISQAGTVSWKEVAHTEVKGRKDIMQFFGDKYGEYVRIVQIGGEAQQLNGYSMELCGGAHVPNTSNIGEFKIKSEGAIAAGVRRIEAVCGSAAQAYTAEKSALLTKEIQENFRKLVAANSKLETLGKEKHSAPVSPGSELKDLEKHLESTKKAAVNADKALKKAQAAAAASQADELLVDLLEQKGNIVKMVEGSANLLQELLNGCKKKQFSGAAFFIIDDDERLHLGALAGSDALDAGIQAGKMIQELSPLAGGKGGGKPDMARGAAPDRTKALLILDAAKEQLLS